MPKYVPFMIQDNLPRLERDGKLNINATTIIASVVTCYDTCIDY